MILTDKISRQLAELFFNFTNENVQRSSKFNLKKKPVIPLKWNFFPTNCFWWHSFFYLKSIFLHSYHNIFSNQIWKVIIFYMFSSPKWKNFNMQQASSIKYQQRSISVVPKYTFPAKHCTPMPHSTTYTHSTNHFISQCFFFNLFISTLNLISNKSFRSFYLDAYLFFHNIVAVVLLSR